MHKIARIQCGNGNCFCVEDNENAILIDSSRAAYYDKILDRCKDKNIRLIILTHGHVDHIQNAAALSKSLNAPIAIHKADYGLIQDNMAQPMSADRLMGKLVLALSIKSFQRYWVEPFEPNIFLCDGDKLDSYGVRGTVVGLPGHTKGSIGI